MTHLEEYTRIINFRKLNPLSEDQYGENHHIKPKSIYPELKDDLDNIVRLSAQEHFLAHYHLWLAYRDELKEPLFAKKMCCAICLMKKCLIKCDDIQTMSKLYEECKIERAKHMSEERKGKQFSAEHRKKLSKVHKGRHLSEEHRMKIAKGNKGRQFSIETRKKISEANKGRQYSEETRKKLSEASKGNTSHLNKHHSDKTRQKIAASIRAWHASHKKQ